MMVMSHESGGRLIVERRWEVCVCVRVMELYRPRSLQAPEKLPL